MIIGIEYNQDGKLEEGIGDSVRPKNKFESQGESIQYSCKTGDGVQCRDVGNEESARKRRSWMWRK